MPTPELKLTPKTPSALVLDHFFLTTTPEEKLEVFNRLVHSTTGKPDDVMMSEAGVMRAQRKRGLVKEQLRADWHCTDERFEEVYAESLEPPRTTRMTSKGNAVTDGFVEKVFGKEPDSPKE